MCLIFAGAILSWLSFSPLVTRTGTEHLARHPVTIPFGGDRIGRRASRQDVEIQTVAADCGPQCVSGKGISVGLMVEEHVVVSYMGGAAQSSFDIWC